MSNSLSSINVRFLLLLEMLSQDNKSHDQETNVDLGENMQVEGDNEGKGGGKVRSLLTMMMSSTGAMKAHMKCVSYRNQQL